MPNMRGLSASLLLVFLLPVILHGQVAPSVLLSQSQLQFTASAGGGVIPAQSVAILNNGGGTVNWTAAAETLTGGGWLAVSPPSGSSPVTMAVR